MIRSILRVRRELMRELPAWSRGFLVRYSIWTSLLALVDIAALMLLALVLGVAASGGSLSVPVIGTFPIDMLPWLVLIVVGAVIAKSAVNMLLQWLATRRFAALEQHIGGRLFRAYIRAHWSSRLGRNTSGILQLSDTGVTNTIVGFLLPLSTVPATIATCVGTLVLISVAQPVTALVTMVYLGAIAVLQYLVLIPKTRQAARVVRNGALRMSTLISGMIGAIKEITLQNRAGEAESVVAQTRLSVSRARANSAFLSVVPRFVLDAALMGGFLVVGGVSYLTAPPDDRMSSALVAVAMFGVAGLRMVPSLTLLQATVTRMATALPYVERVLEDVQSHSDDQEERIPGTDDIAQSPRQLTLSGVSFRYPGAVEPALHDVELEIPMGSRVGVAGASGAGKSTLIDVILGLLEPTSGSVRLDDRELHDVLAGWRHRVGYVPQEVALFEGSIAQNIALTWTDDIDYARVEKAARRAQLWETIASRPGGMDGSVGERGSGFSGGQRQRLGIARALYNEPLVLVLDEATSALDSRTEVEVSDALQSLEGDVTVIAIAHRLSTIRDADRVIFMKDGTIRAQGTFDEVVEHDLDFRRQAELAGLA